MLPGFGDPGRNPPLLPVCTGRTLGQFRLPGALRATRLGQNSKIVHRAYAKKAQGQPPSLEEYEEAKLRADKEGKILVLAA